MKVAIFTLYGTDGPSSQYRVYQYLESIKEYAYVKTYEFWPNIYTNKYMTNRKKSVVQIGALYIINAIKRIFQMLIVAPRYETVIIQKAIVPKCKFTFLTRVLAKKRKIIFDIDDAMYLDRMDNSDKIASRSSLVICGNTVLYNHYKKMSKNIILLPTVENESNYIKYRHNTFEDKIIGWLGTSSNLPNLELIVNPVNTIIERHPEVSFHLICDKSGGYENKIKNLKFIKWEKTSAIQEMSKFTVGIMPLVNNASNRGKCGFKLIQYMTMRKPVIGNPVGENATILEYGGIAADSYEDWIEALESLLFNKNNYDHYCKKIEDDFSEKYSYEKNSKILKQWITKTI